ncbi:uncharacterized protein C8Q71DRAFT_876515 [Rhodofomes roseus]|uniref:F-box domain-containing protein n=1 Tax=Rhodofomes roseus TaxID=34475 RepID=A0ABQ8KU67_9APHY|nr:uncharacterized protein C8Q71DRAFT_876515 [Rhodofomes roseus]KAH9842554.1 hypothetical protein C8Q71DRAFT_876515 [Rhodofomes roseus]
MERKLPNELTDVIINFFWDDPPTMRSCALTCRDWLPRSVFHFQAYLILSIKSVATLSLLSQRLGCPNSRQFYRDMEVMEVSEVFTQIHFAHTVPLHIPGPFLPKLREIEFSHLGRRLGESPPMHWHHSSFTLLSSYKAMTTLRLSNCHFHDAGNLRRVVYALPALDDVTLVDVTFSPRTSLSPELGRRRRQLDRLALRLSGPTVYYGLIYLLEHFINTGWQDRQMPSADATSLVHNIHVKTTTYIYFIDRDYIDLRVTTRRIVDMLSQGVGRNVHTVQLTFHLHERNLLPCPENSTGLSWQPPWTLLQETMRDALPNVRTIELDIRDDSGDDPTPATDVAVRIIPRLFMHWAARGQLLVKVQGRILDTYGQI